MASAMASTMPCLLFGCHPLCNTGDDDGDDAIANPDDPTPSLSGLRRPPPRAPRHACCPRMVFTRIVQPGLRCKYMYSPGERTIFRIAGTIIPRVWPMALLSTVLAIALCFIFDPLRRAERQGRQHQRLRRGRHPLRRVRGPFILVLGRRRAHGAAVPLPLPLPLLLLLPLRLMVAPPVPLAAQEPAYPMQRP